MAERVRITDVAPRDGLQNEAGVIPASGKAGLVRRLARRGVAEVEVSSFVSPKWIPQRGDADEVFAAVAGDRPAGVTFSALVPNERGMEGAEAVNAEHPGLIGKVSVFTAASETFSQKNTNASIDETIARFRPVVERAHAGGMLVRGYVSCVIACPYEGEVPPARVAQVVRKLVKIGVDEIDLGDTIGAGTPETTEALLFDAIEAIDGRRENDRAEPYLTLHLHDTFGRAADCVRAALSLGVRSFDGAVSGLGGCPYASTETSRAPGNIDTALLVRTIEGEGYETGVDLTKLEDAAAWAREIVGGAHG